MLAEYFKDKDGCETIEAEGGFLSYLITGKQFYIADFFIAETHRRSPKHFLGIMQRAHRIALDAGCDFFACHIPLNLIRLNEVLASRLDFGFRLNGVVERNALVMILPLKECKWAGQ